MGWKKDPDPWHFLFEYPDPDLNWVSGSDIIRIRMPAFYKLQDNSYFPNENIKGGMLSFYDFDNFLDLWECFLWEG